MQLQTDSVNTDAKISAGLFCHRFQRSRDAFFTFGIQGVRDKKLRTFSLVFLGPAPPSHWMRIIYCSCIYSWTLKDKQQECIRRKRISLAVPEVRLKSLFHQPSGWILQSPLDLNLHSLIIAFSQDITRYWNGPHRDNVHPTHTDIQAENPSHPLSQVFWKTCCKMEYKALKLIQ